MRSDREILDFIVASLKAPDVARAREAARLQAESEHKKVFYAAAHAVYTHVIGPGMARMAALVAQARLRASFADTGDFYLPTQTDPTMVAKFAMPMGGKKTALPLCVSFKASFPTGLLVYYSDPDKGQAEAVGEVEEVPLEAATAELIEDRLLMVVANHLHEL